jgi:predicted transcriptional regulator of viral defense system
MPQRRSDQRRLLEALAYRQAGYFTAAQAREVGYSYQAQQHHVDAGNWVRVDRGLFRLQSWPPGVDDQWVRWSLWSGGRGVVSHESALRVHGLSDVDPASIHFTVPPGFRTEDPLVVVHRESLGDADVEVREGWRVTTPLRTLVDVAGGALSQEIVDAAVADALEHGVLTRRGLRRKTADLPDRAALRLERALAAAEGVASDAAAAGADE